MKDKEDNLASMTMIEMKTHIAAKAHEDSEFRARLLENPKAVIASEFNVAIPEHYSVHVYEDDGETAHLVLPTSDHLTEKELAQVAGGGDAWNWQTY